MLEYKGLKIEWLGHACFKIKDDFVVYIDPFKIKKDRADVILITHEHFDHCSLEDIEKIWHEGTKIIASTQCKDILKPGWDVKFMRPGDKITVKGLAVEAVPAYNIGKKFHPKADEKLGYVVEVDGVRIYHAGDTDLIPEMSSLKNIDIALLPVGGTYTMNAEEAAKAASTIKPKIAIPMHYGSIVGSREDAEKFKSLVKTRVEFG